MPRQVDQEGRRHRIAEAVCGLADESGLEGVTLRDVAARAEVSTGAVQRCFRNKDEMLLFAVRHVGAQVTERVRERTAHDGPSAASAAQTLARAAGEVALLGEKRRAEARVWLAFVARAAVSRPLAESLRADYADLEQLFSRLVAEAARPLRGGDTDAAIDPQREARALLALADGLTAHVLVGHLGRREAEDVLAGHLTELQRRIAHQG